MNNLKDFRKKANSTQREVSDYCGISLKTYQRIERGERKGEIGIWRNLADYYGTTIDKLFEPIKNNQD